MAVPHNANGSAWRLLGASLTGRAHLERGLPNQDALSAASGRDGSLFLAVADGAGSAPRSAEGARVACRTAILSMAASDTREPEPLLRRALDKAAAAVHGHARRTGKPAREYACTLLLAFATEAHVAALQLGDGAVVTASEDGLDRLTPGWQSAYAGETVFITSPGAGSLASVTSRKAKGVSGIALLTDGLEPVATDLASSRPFGPFFGPLFEFTAASGDAGQLGERNRQLEGLLGSERIRDRTHDDTTLLLAARRAS